MLAGLLVALSSLAFNPARPGRNNCIYWVAPSPAGSDAYPGTYAQPWGTLEHAARTIPDGGCTVWFRDGVYTGSNRVTRAFERFAWFRAVHPYGVVFMNDGPVLSITGGARIIVEGFVFQHAGPGASPLLVQVARGASNWSEYIILRNNIFRNSYNDDLLKIYNGAKFVTVQGNLFYNQGPNEQQMDVNSVTDVVIEDNIFFNDFAASRRPVRSDTKHYIVIKDSNENEDGLLGSQRITVQRNIFLNWQGGSGETFIQVGNDGKQYFEAREITVQNNLFLGNSSIPMRAPFGISGASDVYFLNNTVSGDLPSNSYAARITIKDRNPKNRNILFCNNIWSDPAGTMGSYGPADGNDFAEGDPTDTERLVLVHNLYWNGGEKIPDGSLLSPLKDDGHRTIADPRLNQDFKNLVPPIWDGKKFPDGATRIEDVFTRLVREYGALPRYSPAIGIAYLDCIPRDDISRRARGFFPSLGADQGPVEVVP